MSFLQYCQLFLGDNGCDRLDQSCKHDRRPSKALSPIYEMDVGEAFEHGSDKDRNVKVKEREEEEKQRGDEDKSNEFAERDWSMLRQLLSDHESNLGVINPVPEELNLAQYVIKQTLSLSWDSLDLQAFLPVLREGDLQVLGRAHLAHGGLLHQHHCHQLLPRRRCVSTGRVDHRGAGNTPLTDREEPAGQLSPSL